jgi:hypothetical protein
LSHLTGPDYQDPPTIDRPGAALDGGHCQVGQRARLTLSPRAGAPPSAKRAGEEPLKNRVEPTVAMSSGDRGPQLMEDLILADDDGVEPDRDRDGVSHGRLADEDIAARRQHRYEVVGA